MNSDIRSNLKEFTYGKSAFIWNIISILIMSIVINIGLLPHWRDALSTVVGVLAVTLFTFFGVLTLVNTTTDWSNKYGDQYVFEMLFLIAAAVFSFLFASMDLLQIFRSSVSWSTIVFMAMTVGLMKAMSLINKKSIAGYLERATVGSKIEAVYIYVILVLAGAVQGYAMIQALSNLFGDVHLIVVLIVGAFWIGCGVFLALIWAMNNKGVRP